MNKNINIKDKSNFTKTVIFQPLTSKNWKDFVKLFGTRGACGGCWCMYWRLTKAHFEKQKGNLNKKAMKEIVSSGKIPGILAYSQKEPIGWCALAPREIFIRLEKARTLKRVDTQKVWSIVCLFIAKPYRKKGLSTTLIKGAIDFAQKQGAKIIESYPFELKQKNRPDPFVWTGLASSYRKAGFEEVLRRSATRPIMRYYL